MDAGTGRGEDEEGMKVSLSKSCERPAPQGHEKLSHLLIVEIWPWALAARSLGMRPAAFNRAEHCRVVKLSAYIVLKHESVLGTRNYMYK